MIRNITMKTKTSPAFLFALTIASAVAISSFTGCATFGGKPTYTRNLPPSDRIVAGDKVKVDVTAAGPKVVITSSDRERFANKIEVKVRERAPAGAHGGRNYKLVVALTRYERGSAFARMMLAGLGQMHIDANVSMYSPPGNKLVGQFNVNKTFSWGGAVGQMATIENVEDDFGKAVADAVCAPNPAKH